MDLDAFNQQRITNNVLLKFIYKLKKYCRIVAVNSYDPFCLFQVYLRSRPLWDITDGLPAQMPLLGFISPPLLHLTTERATVWGTSEYSRLLSHLDFICFMNQVYLISVQIWNAKSVHSFYHLIDSLMMSLVEFRVYYSILHVYCFLMHYINNHTYIQFKAIYLQYIPIHSKNIAYAQYNVLMASPGS